MSDFDREPAGYKCASCGIYRGDWIPEDDCPKCGCMTAEVRYHIYRKEELPQ